MQPTRTTTPGVPSTPVEQAKPRAMGSSSLLSAPLASALRVILSTLRSAVSAPPSQLPSRSSVTGVIEGADARSPPAFVGTNRKATSGNHISTTLGTRVASHMQRWERFGTIWRNRSRPRKSVRACDRCRACRICSRRLRVRSSACDRGRCRCRTRRHMQLRRRHGASSPQRRPVPVRGH